MPVLISLGSNIQPVQNIKAAIELLSEKFDPLILSSIWESPAVGSSGPNYLNSAILFYSDLSPVQIKEQILTPIENILGRVRSQDKYMDRTIDLDPLVYNQFVVDSDLWDQAHLALPASEICPDLINPASGETLLETATKLLKKAAIFRRIDLID